ncbi:MULTISPECIES: hypothetical protein [unclassified Streptomyces]|uniref:hypothetical protein n=1 Tax=unclassified Streptomyces TaxID=2593676 RepID=UPI0037FEFCDD
MESSDATARPDGLDFLAELPARGEWCTTVLVRPSVEAEEAGSVFRPGVEPGESEPARRLRAWRESAPRITDNWIRRRNGAPPVFSASCSDDRA